ncbi:ead/Ea22-like family protein [Klebsiella pneumoniae]
MTTDITELTQSLKAAATNVKETAHIARYLKATIARQTFKELMTPDNILALVEALEKAQQRIVELDRKNCELDSLTQRWAVERAENADRIAELESRTVTVKQGEVLVTVAGFTGCGKSAIAGEIEIAMKAIGLPVTWANGDSEKRTTGADWLTAIEMYKPTVRIVEVNIPRAAGIKVEAE